MAKHNCILFFLFSLLWIHQDRINKVPVFFHPAPPLPPLKPGRRDGVSISVNSPSWEISMLVPVTFRPLWATELDLYRTGAGGWDSVEGGRFSQACLVQQELFFQMADVV